MGNYLNGTGKEFCLHCEKHRTPEGHDGCIGTLKNVMNACCGHGETKMAYVQFKHEKYKEEPNKIRIEGEDMSNKKKLNRKIRQKYEREKEMKENPDTCFCEEPEYDEKIPIGETEKVYYSIYDYQRENPFSLPIYKCNNCGKKHVLVFVQA